MDAQAPKSGAQAPQAPAPSQGGMQGGASQGGAMPGMNGSASPSTAPGTPGAQMSDMDQMMRRIAEHSTYMETVQDQAMFQQEMLRHQEMLDQMMQLMQR